MNCASGAWRGEWRARVYPDVEYTNAVHFPHLISCSFNGARLFLYLRKFSPAFVRGASGFSTNVLPVSKRFRNIRYPGSGSQQLEGEEKRLKRKTNFVENPTTSSPSFRPLPFVKSRDYPPNKNKLSSTRARNASPDPFAEIFRSIRSVQRSSAVVFARFRQFVGMTYSIGDSCVSGYAAPVIFGRGLFPRIFEKSSEPKRKIKTG